MGLGHWKAQRSHHMLWYGVLACIHPQSSQQLCFARCHNGIVLMHADMCADMCAVVQVLVELKGTALMCCPIDALRHVLS